LWVLLLLVAQLLLLLLLLMLLLLLLLLVVSHNGRDGQPVLGEMSMGANDVHVGCARVTARAGVGPIP